MTDTDVIVIGSGAGGGTIANRLARAGKRVLILERGDWLPREPDNWNPSAVFVDGRYVSREQWLDGAGNNFQPQSHYFVGGATKLYGAALFRLRPADFTATMNTGGESPAWPVDYDEFEPWYTAAEQMYHVRGRHGEDPTGGRWSQQYGHPPLSHEPRIQDLADQFRDRGLHPFHAPCGVLLDEAEGPTVMRTSLCQRCSMCDGYPCPLGAKADAETIGIEPIMHLPNVVLERNARVTRLRRALDDPRRIASVEWLQYGETFRATADTIVLSAGAVNSAVIMLRSGLGNESDQVGRNFMMHNSRAVIAIGSEPNPTRYQKTLAIHDWYRDLGSIQMIGKSNAEALKANGGPLGQMMPMWSADRVTRHAVDFWLMVEDVPKAESRVTLDAGRIKLRYRQTGSRQMKQLLDNLRHLLNATGFIGHHIVDRPFMMSKGIPLAGIAHQAGTLRFGDDRDTSVLDRNCRFHGLDNLFAVDASFMPSVGAVNPALTIMANALRVGDYLINEGTGHG